MKAKVRFVIAACVLGLLMVGPFGLTALLLFLDSKDAEREAFAQFLLPRLPLGGFMTVMGFIGGVMLLRSLFQQYVHGLSRMAETLRLMLGANRNFRVALDGPPEVCDLARAANDLAQQRNELLDDVEAQIRVAKATVEEEKNRLAALMSELAQGVVVCNLDGRILLYNNRARLQLREFSQMPDLAAGAELIGKPVLMRNDWFMGTTSNAQWSWVRPQTTPAMRLPSTLVNAPAPGAACPRP